MSFDTVRLLVTVVIYAAGVPLFWGYAVDMIAADDELATINAPSGVIKGVIKVIAGVLSLFWPAVITWELAETVWDYRPWGNE